MPSPDEPTLVIASATISSATVSGSVVTNSYVEMPVTVYALPEPVADSMSELNAQTTLFFSLAGLSASIPIGIYINEIFAGDIPKVAQQAINLTFAMGCAVAIVFVCLAVRAWWKRRGIWANVKTTSKIR